MDSVSVQGAALTSVHGSRVVGGARGLLTCTGASELEVMLGCFGVRIISDSESSIVLISP